MFKTHHQPLPQKDIRFPLYIDFGRPYTQSLVADRILYTVCKEIHSALQTSSLGFYTRNLGYLVCFSFIKF